MEERFIRTKCRYARELSKCYKDNGSSGIWTHDLSLSGRLLYRLPESPGKREVVGSNPTRSVIFVTLGKFTRVPTFQVLILMHGWFHILILFGWKWSEKSLLQSDNRPLFFAMGQWFKMLSLALTVIWTDSPTILTLNIWTKWKFSQKFTFFIAAKSA